MIETKFHRIDTNLVAVSNMSPYEAFWDLCKICIDSKTNTTWTLNDLQRLFMPPIIEGNYRVFYEPHESESLPRAFCTWAWLNEEVDKKVRFDFVDPQPHEWNSGSNLWIIDLVSTKGDTKKIASYLQKQVFVGAPGKWAWALRREETGIVQKVARWPIRAK